VSKEKKKQAKEDQTIRNTICQKVWGLRKLRFGLNWIVAKLDNTSQTAIAITFLVMNLSTWWRRFFFVFVSFGENNACFWAEHKLRLCFLNLM
jgi:transposase, IS5 family